jgi:hypothetical protein
MIGWNEDHYSIRIALQNGEKRQLHRYAGAPIQRLLEDASLVHVAQLLGIKLFVGTCHDEQLPVILKKRFDAGSCLRKKTLAIEDRTKLFRPRVAHDFLG